MKKIFLGLCICICLNVSANQNRNSNYSIEQLPDTTVLSQILALNLNHYIGLPVDSLLSVLPVGYTDRGFMPARIGYCRGVFQSYGTSESNSCGVEIFIDNFQFMTFPNRTKTSTWDMSLAKKETIAYIRIIKNNQCIYGCNNSNYYD